MNQNSLAVADNSVIKHTVPLKGGKAQLYCTVEHRWVKRMSRELLCGMEYKCTFKKETGIAEKQFENQQSKLEGAGGMQGIASLKMEVAHQSGRALQMTRLESF
jgi:hypothetical protein